MTRTLLKFDTNDDWRTMPIWALLLINKRSADWKTRFERFEWVMPGVIYIETTWGWYHVSRKHGVKFTRWDQTYQLD